MIDLEKKKRSTPGAMYEAHVEAEHMYGTVVTVVTTVTYAPGLFASHGILMGLFSFTS